MCILFFINRYEVALECVVEGGYNNATLSWWVAGTQYDNSVDKIIERDHKRNKKRQLINGLLYR